LPSISSAYKTDGTRANLVAQGALETQRARSDALFTENGRFEQKFTASIFHVFWRRITARA